MKPSQEWRQMSDRALRAWVEESEEEDEMTKEEYPLTVRSFVAQVKALADRLSPEEVRSVTLGMHGCSDEVLAELEQIEGATREVYASDTEEWDAVGSGLSLERMSWDAYGRHRSRCLCDPTGETAGKRDARCPVHGEGE